MSDEAKALTKRTAVSLLVVLLVERLVKILLLRMLPLLFRVTGLLLRRTFRLLLLLLRLLMFGLALVVWGR